MRQLLINIFRERFYLMIKHSITAIICLQRGITNRGINISISPWAKIKGGHRIRLGSNVLIERDVMLNAGEPNSLIEIGADISRDEVPISYPCLFRNHYKYWVLR